MPTASRSCVPPDHGLTLLGLLMQLAGTALAIAAATVGAVELVAGHATPTAPTLWIVLVAIASVVRSLAHRGAGTRLVYGARAPGVPGPVQLALPDERRLAGVSTYLLVALAHVAIVTAIAGLCFEVSAPHLAALAGALLVWPLALSVLIAQPALRTLGRRLPAGPDQGFEALAIVMAVLGAAGLGAGVLVIGFLLGQPPERPHMAWLLALAFTIVGIARSSLQLAAGLDGLQETARDASVARVVRYARFAERTAVATCGMALALVTIGHFEPTSVALALGALGLLLAWPMIVRRFVTDRQFAEQLGGAPAPHLRAPDAGLTGLGWLLAGSSALALAWLLLRASNLGAILVLPSSALPVSTGAQLGVIALGAWAAIELVGMTSRARLAAVAWAVAAGGLAVHVVAPELPSAASHPQLYDRFADLAWFAGQFVLAAATIRLATRRVGPIARARIAGSRSTIAA